MAISLSKQAAISSSRIGRSSMIAPHSRGTLTIDLAVAGTVPRPKAKHMPTSPAMPVRIA
jgi:hypothetical protein